MPLQLGVILTVCRFSCAHNYAPHSDCKFGDSFIGKIGCKYANAAESQVTEFTGLTINLFVQPSLLFLNAAYHGACHIPQATYSTPSANNNASDSIYGI